MVTKQTNLTVPLSDQDALALDALFEAVAMEDIKQIEVAAGRYSTAPLDPKEELGWIVNSSLPTPE